MFIKNIVMSKGNPMSIKYHSYKVEFALRGAGHIHGVLWVDWDKMKIGGNDDKEDVVNIEAALSKIKMDEQLSTEEKESIVWFADKFISCSLKDPRTEAIVKAVNMHHHTKTCRKYDCKCRFFSPRFPCLRTIVAEPVRMTSTSPEKQKEILDHYKQILEKVKIVLEDENAMEEIRKVHEEDIDEYKQLLQLVQKIELLLEENVKQNKNFPMFINDKDIKESLADFVGDTIFTEQINRKCIEEHLTELNRKLNDKCLDGLLKNRLIALLKKSGVPGDDDDIMIEEYEKALSVSTNGYRVIHKRDIDEIFVNNYNPEWIINWNANMDLQLCLDFFAVITYISDYYSKDDSGTMKHIKEALKQAENDSLKNKLSLVSHTFLTHRQIGESEAYFRILPHLHMKESNIEAVFIATGFKQNRSRFLRKLEDGEVVHCDNPIEVEGRDGFYTEKPSLIDKYMRRDFNDHQDVFDISYLQFAKKYTPTRTGPKDEEAFKPKEFVKVNGEIKEHSKLDFIVTHNFNDDEKQVVKFLPKYIKINDVQPGEPGFMKLRSMMVARLHKLSQTKSPHEFYYSEIQLYRPFNDEGKLYPNSLDKCKELYDELSEHNDTRKVTNVKNILMEHLEAVEDGSDKAKEIIDSNAGVTMDAENEQDNAECADEEVEEHPDFDAKNPDNLECKKTTGNAYKKIELYTDEKIKKLTLQLDKEQRFVLDIGVDFAKNVVKARKGTIPLPKAPLLIVQGGAGTGKSTLIDAMSQCIERILRTPGDHPAHPYIIKAAFTGTAAANIVGQTMHSAFSFNFGNEFLSLGDKSRDEKRKLLENLQVVIIDEYSMIKADMLYQLDLRLKELKQRPELPFGGVSVFLFGDILQLRPVKAVYIFEEPKCENFQLTFLLDPLWDKFDVVMLITNHRQGEDKEYADILNRIRVGDIQEEDMKRLEDRVRPINHSDIPKEALLISCKNEGVNAINEEKLALINNNEFLLEATAKTQTQKTLKPRTDASGAIRNTPLQKILKLKIGARIMLTYNIDTCDCLTNGTFGEVIGFEFNEMDKVTRVIVNFDNEASGRERRKNHVELQRIHHPKLATPIDKIEFSYSLSKKPRSATSNAVALQFPLRLAFAATAHKIQGSTIKKPNCLVVDLRTVMQAAQAYVMLSRVQSISQLIILVAVSSKKLYASPIAMQELDRMRRLALNNNHLRKSIVSCNIRSLSSHFEDLITTPELTDADVICLQETWLNPSDTDGFEIEGFVKHLNSVGCGKGIATYCKVHFTSCVDVKCDKYQMTKISSDSRDIINIYRSGGAPSENFKNDLRDLFDPKKETFLVGDFNLCFNTDEIHPVLKDIVTLGFEQKVEFPTHIEGRLIDHVYFFSPTTEERHMKVKQQSPYFTDHDILYVIDVS